MTAPLYANTQLPRAVRIADTTQSSLYKYLVSVPTPAAGTAAIGESPLEEAAWSLAISNADPTKVKAMAKEVSAKIAAGQAKPFRYSDL